MPTGPRRRIEPFGRVEPFISRIGAAAKQYCAVPRSPLPDGMPPAVKERWVACLA